MNLSDIKPFLLTKFKSEQDLVKSIEKLSLNFTTNRSEIEDYHNDEKMIAAYAAFYLTTNFPKYSHCMNYLSDYNELLGNSEIIDIGVGPGTFMFAIGEHYNWKLKSTLWGIETSHLMRKQAAKIKEGLFADKDMEIVSKASLIPPKTEGLNRVVIFTHSYNEMGLDAAKKYIEQLQPDTIVFIEPGTKELFHSYVEMRKELIAQEYFCHYPCPTNNECPMEGKEDWCHQYLKVTHDKEVERLTQIAHKNRKWMPVTLALYRKGQARTTKPDEAVIVRTYQESKFGFDWDICTASSEYNTLKSTQLLKRNFSKSQAKEVAKLLAGDRIEYEVDKELKDNKTRIKLKGNFND